MGCLLRGLHEVACMQGCTLQVILPIRNRRHRESNRALIVRFVDEPKPTITHRLRYCRPVLLLGASCALCRLSPPARAARPAPSRSDDRSSSLRVASASSVSVADVSASARTSSEKARDLERALVCGLRGGDGVDGKGRGQLWRWAS